mmetsp:Transcript_49212/g.73361  ORF Transcript_49212/g.73361 Transcript_49212/m.73361 type:complete len:88 (+) Transcript_49212:39-302(+)
MTSAGDGGMFFADMKTLSAAAAVDDNGNHGPIEIEDVNCHALADQTLRSITAEYEMTVKGVDVEKEKESTEEGRNNKTSFRSSFFVK